MMSALATMVVGFAIVWAGLSLYVLRLYRITRSLEAEAASLREERGG